METPRTPTVGNESPTVGNESPTYTPDPAAEAARLRVWLHDLKEAAHARDVVTCGVILSLLPDAVLGDLDGHLDLDTLDYLRASGIVTMPSVAL